MWGKRECGSSAGSIVNQIGNPHDCFFRGGEAHARLSREEVNPDLVDLTEAGLRDQLD